jgi:hypothetical protein
MRARLLLRWTSKRAAGHVELMRVGDSRVPPIEAVDRSGRRAATAEHCAAIHLPVRLPTYRSGRPNPGWKERA